MQSKYFTIQYKIVEMQRGLARERHETRGTGVNICICLCVNLHVHTYTVTYMYLCIL